jgi:hypothetical protein
MPALNRVGTDYQTRGVKVVGIAVDESGWQVVRPFVAQYRIRYPVAVADRETRRSYREGLDTLPFTLLLNREGRVLARFNSALSEDELRALLDAALERDGR